MTDTDKVMNPHFGSDPADIGIWINPEIQIWILHHFWLRFRPLLEFVLSAQSSLSCNDDFSQKNCGCNNVTQAAHNLIILHKIIMQHSIYPQTHLLHRCTDYSQRNLQFLGKFQSTFPRVLQSTFHTASRSHKNTIVKVMKYNKKLNYSNRLHSASHKSLHSRIWQYK